MLSRAAESLYWMGRSMERAEDIARLLDVTYEFTLEVPPQEAVHAWWPLVETLGHAQAFGEEPESVSAERVIEFLLWDPANPSAVVTCIRQARENARSARKQISTEMWEHLNRGYFMVKDVDRVEVRRAPHRFLDEIRNLSQAFQGITAATMMHGEPYEFIQLGTCIERASETVYALRMKHAAIMATSEGSPSEYRHLFALLKSCSAFEPFRRTHASQLQFWRMAQHLLQSNEFPRAVLFCLRRCLSAVEMIGGSGAHALLGSASLRLAPTGLEAPHRAFGRKRVINVWWGGRGGNADLMLLLGWRTATSARSSSTVSSATSNACCAR